MGLLGKLLGHGSEVKDGVRGTAQVVECPTYDGKAEYKRAQMDLVIRVDGMPDTPAQFTGLVPTAKWPIPGVELPVSVDPRDPQRFSILWDDVETVRERGRRQAEAVAGGGSPAAATAPSDDRLSRLERLTELREQGALTDAEFDAEKRRILGDG